MAWTRLLPSGRYQACYRDGNGEKQTAGTFTQRAEALRKAGAKEEEQRGPLALDVAGGKITWAAWFELWHDSRVLSYSTDDNYRSLATNHIGPWLGTKQLAELTQLDVSRWVKKLVQPPRRAKYSRRSPWTMRGALMLLNTSLNAAVDARRIPINPAKRVPYPDLPQAVERFLTPDEVESIAFYMDGLNRLILWSLVQTGPRFGELSGLHWPQLDLDRGTVQIIEQFDQKQKVIKVPKDKEARTVPLPGDLVALLRGWREHGPARASTCGIEHVGGRCTGDLVFRGPRGAALKSNEWGAGPWKRALALAGIEGRVRPHDLRHTYASWLIQERISIPELAALMGHSDWEVTRRYAHLSDHGHDDVRQALTRHRAAARAANPPETAGNGRKLEAVQ